MIKIALYSIKYNIRIEKIARALKQIGNYEITLICNEYINTDKSFIELFNNIIIVSVIDKLIHISRIISDSNEILKYIRGKLYRLRSEKYYKRNLLKVINKLKANKYDLIYLFDHDRSVSNIKYILQNTNIKTVFDAYDLSIVSEAYSYKDKNKNLSNDFVIEDEKFCLEHVNGICSKFNLEIYDYLNKNNYEIKAKKIHFMDYCSDINCYPINYSKKLSKQLKIVFVGVLPMDNYPFFQDIEKLNQEKIKFYLYSQNFVWHTKKKLKVFYDLQNKKRVKICGFISNDKLSKEISQYDFALGNTFNEKYKIVNEIYYSNMMGNKIFSYLEAGIPIITHKDAKSFSYIIDKYKVGISIKYEDRNNIDKIINTLDYQQLLRNIDIARTGDLSLFKNAPRLDKFIKDIIGNKN